MKTTNLITAIMLFGIVFTANAQTAWDTNGNALATPNSNFLGTTTDNDLIFKRNNVLSGSIGVSNTAFGESALSSTSLTGTSNTAFGRGALGVNTTGTDNIGIGYQALWHNTTGANNVAIGWRAMGINDRGVNNVAIGLQALYFNNNHFNTAVGHLAGYKTTGMANVFLGREAGYHELGSHKLYIQNSSNPNPLIYGEFDTRKLAFNVDGTGSKVEIRTSAAGASGLAFNNLNSASAAPANTTGGKFLTVNGGGDVILETIPASIGANIYSADGTLAGNRTVSMNNNSMIFNTSDNGRIYIGNDSPAFNTATFPTTSGNYRLYVEGGILSERVKVALKSGSDWADYVFAPDYKLMPLDVVEAFIKQNQHLPKVSSSEELLQTGLDLSYMQAKQMEKIEELTLYLIDQNKRLQQQNESLIKQNQELEALKLQVKLLIEKK